MCVLRRLVLVGQGSQANRLLRRRHIRQEYASAAATCDFLRLCEARTGNCSYIGKGGCAAFLERLDERGGITCRQQEYREWSGTQLVAAYVLSMGHGAWALLARYCAAIVSHTHCTGALRVHKWGQNGHKPPGWCVPLLSLART